MFFLDLNVFTRPVASIAAMPRVPLLDVTQATILTEAADSFEAFNPEPTLSRDLSRIDSTLLTVESTALNSAFTVPL